LVAGDVALAAAHCVHGKGQSFTFRAGYSDGAAIASRTVEDVVIADGYLTALATGDRVAAIANDIALVRLTSPIYEPGANPYEIASSPAQGTELTLASYGQGRMEALTLERGCALEVRFREGIVGMDCDATFGSSGAPVFTQVGGRIRIFSVVSSITTPDEDGQPQTLGVELTEIVPDLLAALNNKRTLAPVSTGARRITVGKTEMEGGALFVRP